ncbi:hypothetical protein B9Z55_028275 [Caenorhabditis nigoni]|uniref:Uncharacterized protein n=1 Tax=Caenorhabditis nigoni TaxID=1611254 RepID=A0A2G5SC43_9PELO|nr:hypothetical protein B9Z55_028275 [Caenorhabditis nigoni]
MYITRLLVNSEKYKDNAIMKHGDGEAVRISQFSSWRAGALGAGASRAGVLGAGVLGAGVRRAGAGIEGSELMEVESEDRS